MTPVSSALCSLYNVQGLSSSATCSITGNVLSIQNPFGATDSLGNDRIVLTIGNNYI